MKIACLAKYCIDPTGLVIDRTKNIVDLDRSPRKVSEADLNAVEEAVRIKSALTGSAVHIFTVGTSESSRSLRELLAMGADKSFLISTQAKARLDGFTIASLLGKAIEKFGPYDLIMAGHASEDNYAGAVALMLAQILNMEHIAYVSKLKVENNGSTIRAERAVDDTIEIVESKLPIFITVTRDINNPRFPTTLQILRVPRDASVVVKPADLGISEEEGDILRNSRTEQVEQTLVRTTRKNVILDGSVPTEAARKIVEALRREKVLR